MRHLQKGGFCAIEDDMKRIFPLLRSADLSYSQKAIQAMHKIRDEIEKGL
jgi:hypothetical protein